MEANDRSGGAATLSWGRRVVGLARKASERESEPAPTTAVALRAHDDYSQRAKKTESKLDFLIFALGLSILVDPYRTIAR